MSAQNTGIRGKVVVARAIAFAIEQPHGIDVSEFIVRPTASPY
jgi:NADP-dependent 3-hydroxy acid dehydrogenase YdfG